MIEPAKKIAEYATAGPWLRASRNPNVVTNAAGIVVAEVPGSAGGDEPLNDALFIEKFDPVLSHALLVVLSAAASVSNVEVTTPEDRELMERLFASVVRAREVLENGE